VFTCSQKVKDYLLEEGTDLKYGARHLKRAIERGIVFPLANLVATGQVRLGDFVRIDMSPEGRMTFTKEAEGAMVPVLLEKFGPETAVPAVARAARSAGNRREAGASSLLDHK
ncbi:MAG TPA: ATP-dependent Clp protease ATP-binding subunit, partial [Terriglobales bacterium]|nr:ATP-dependent Clp protease ATP-binding subunit [Terriglobales bacterium]